MNLNSPKDVSQWALKASTGTRNKSITTHMTCALPATLGALVRLLDETGYIFAFWRKGEDEHGQARWTWELTRTARKLSRERMAGLMHQALIDAKSRETFNEQD